MSSLGALRPVGSTLQALDDGALVVQDVHRFSFDAGLVVTPDAVDPSLAHVTTAGGGGVTLQIAYDNGEVITTTVADGPVEIRRGAAAAEPALLLSTPFSGALPVGANLGIVQMYEDFGGANQHIYLTTDANIAGTALAAGMRRGANDVVGGHIPKSVIIGDPGVATQTTDYLRIYGWAWSNAVKHYVDFGPYNFGMSMETSASIFEMFIGGGVAPLASDQSTLSVRHKPGGSVTTQGSRIEARDDNDVGGFTVSCEYDTPRLYITNTPGGLAVKDILHTALGGSSAAGRGQHRFQRKTTPTAGVSMVGATEAADVYGRGYVATIRTDAIPISGETGFVLDSVPAASFVAERVSLTEPTSNVTQVNGGRLRSEGRFWTGAVPSTHFGDLLFEAISGINEGRRWAMYDDATEYVAWRYGGGADTYWQAIGGGRIFLQDFAGNNAIVFHQAGIIEVDVIQSRSATAWKVFADGDAVFGAQVMSGTERLRLVDGDLLAESTSAGAIGSVIQFYHNSASPAASDVVGRILWQGEDDAGNTTNYAQLDGIILDPSNTGPSEDGAFQVSVINAGTLARLFQLRADGGIAGAERGAVFENFLAAGATTYQFEFMLSDDTATVGPILSLRRMSTSPAAADEIGAIAWRGQDDGTPDDTVEYARMYVEIDDPVEGTADSRIIFNTLEASVVNEAVRFLSTGQIEADLGAGTGNVTVFDDYDDAMVLREMFPMKESRKQEALDRLEEMGVVARKDSGSGYMLNFQAMFALLAGGVYQTRERFDALAEENAMLHARVVALEAQARGGD